MRGPGGAGFERCGIGRDAGAASREERGRFPVSSRCDIGLGCKPTGSKPSLRDSPSSVMLCMTSSPARGERARPVFGLAQIVASREHRSMSPTVAALVLKRFAREQRANAVQAEAIVWRALRDRRCERAKFRRQVAIGNFIVDFVCFENRLIVEIDGPSHEGAERQAKDDERDAWFREQRFQVLRLPNGLVIASTELAVARIRAALGG
jgi:very-short-patch-repair endonuclease